MEDAVYVSTTAITGIAMMFGIGWLCYRVPLAGTLFKLLLFATWGGMSVVAPIYVALAIHLPRHPWPAFFCLLLACVLAVPFALIAIPETKKTIKDKGNFALWYPD